jgi:YfiH family protein
VNAVPPIDPAPALRSSLLEAPGVAHAFFTRQGGVSRGVYASLNGGVGSNDDPEAVAENRGRMASTLGVSATSLLVPYQIHSNLVAVVDAPFSPALRPRVDGLVTRTRGLALGVTGADCGMILFSDAAAGVVGACHAGWKGALTGVLEATLDAMEGLGAARANVSAVLGPTIGPLSYEVGPEFFARFVAAHPSNGRFFKDSPRDGHALFDLPGYIGARAVEAGIGRFKSLGFDTYANEDRFYSYRRATHRGEADYGRLISAIALV